MMIGCNNGKEEDECLNLHSKSQQQTAAPPPKHNKPKPPASNAASAQPHARAHLYRQHVLPDVIPHLEDGGQLGLDLGGWVVVVGGGG